jgi:transposase
MADLFGVGGRALLAATRLAPESRARVDSALRLIEQLDFEVELFAKLVAGRLCTDPGYRAIQVIPGIGPILAGVFIAEIGDITRFPGPAQLASWAGLTPKHHESDTTVHRGRITKQGSRLVRWAAIEAVRRLPVQSTVCARVGPPRPPASSARTGCRPMARSTRKMITATTCPMSV